MARRPSAPARKSRSIPNPFAGERVKGRKFTKREVQERLKFFGALFNVPPHDSD